MRERPTGAPVERRFLESLFPILGLSDQCFIIFSVPGYEAMVADVE